ncbi:MAG: hypothetical protein AMS20_02815 [Gemmatimonas sp. SG8_28]|jgi:hypothetical protein|nr:MAG: hypothetical protein AMS20_02815 [Gemmatimonas sp. SG8_28]
MRHLGATIVLVLIAGCGAEAPSDGPGQPTSQRARDSAVAQSGLPGAEGVGRAMTVADSAAARRALEDSLAREQP